jgi:dTDP-D-glucose 4,6-dehydratase
MVLTSSSHSYYNKTPQKIDSIQDVNTTYLLDIVIVIAAMSCVDQPISNPARFWINVMRMS